MEFLEVLIFIVKPIWLLWKFAKWMTLWLLESPPEIFTIEDQ